MCRAGCGSAGAALPGAADPIALPGGLAGTGGLPRSVNTASTSSTSTMPLSTSVTSTFSLGRALLRAMMLSSLLKTSHHTRLLRA